MTKKQLLRAAGICLVVCVACLALLLNGCADHSPTVTISTELSTITGPTDSVGKLTSLFDLDLISHEVAKTLGVKPSHTAINILGWDRFNVVCNLNGARDALACFNYSNDTIYFHTSYINNLYGNVIAHEFVHHYGVMNEAQAREIACGVMPCYYKNRVNW